MRAAKSMLLVHRAGGQRNHDYETVMLFGQFVLGRFCVRSLAGPEAGGLLGGTP
jgi:hypothetical protein